MEGGQRTLANKRYPILAYSTYHGAGLISSIDTEVKKNPNDFMSTYKLYNALRKAFCTLTTETFKSDFFYAMNKSVVTEHAWCVSACGDGVVLGNIIPSHVLNRYTKIVSSTLA